MHLIDLQTSGGNAVLKVDSSTTTLSSSPTPAPTVTFDDHTYLADSQGAYIIDNQTLTPGGVVSVSGTYISLAPNASVVEIGTSTDLLGSGGNSVNSTGIAPAKHQKSVAIREKRLAMGTWVACLVAALVGFL